MSLSSFEGTQRSHAAGYGRARLLVWIGIGVREDLFGQELVSRYSVSGAAFPMAASSVQVVDRYRYRKTRRNWARDVFRCVGSRVSFLHRLASRRSLPATES